MHRTMSDLLQSLQPHLDDDAGPVILAATRWQDQELSSETHQHARGQLFGSLRGLISVTVEDGVWIVPAIHAVWLPPHHRHSGRSFGPYHGWSAYVARSACVDLPARPCTLRISGLLREAVLRLAASWTPPAQPPRSPELDNVSRVVLDEIRHLPRQALGLPLPTDWRVQRIAQALIQNPADARDLTAWADWGALSSRTLSRRFAAETGYSFSAWRQRLRLLRSLELLAEGVPVSHIALDLGWASPSAFIQLFKREFGDTPGIYRARLGS